MSQIVATFYKFVQLLDYQQLKLSLLAQCRENQIKGTILLAEEGINATIAGNREGIDALLSFLRQDERFRDLMVRESLSDLPPFERMKVKLKKEIVTFGQPRANPNQSVGIYVNPQDWNDLIQSSDVLVVDTRNHYEVEIGTFKRAVNPRTRSFKEFADYVERSLDPHQQPKIAMFCTGGIRCEKASSYLKQKGFQEVYHLKGGILNYLAEIPQAESLWEGECFVFDERVAIKHGLDVGNYQMCLSCGHPISEHDKSSENYQEGVFCPYCIAQLTPEKQERQQAKRRQKLVNNQQKSNR